MSNGFNLQLLLAILYRVNIILKFNDTEYTALFTNNRFMLWWNDSEKCFKICNIPKFVFISILSNFGFLIVKEKNILYGFFIPKIGQTILSDLLDNFIKYKPHISEVCMHRYSYVRPHSLIKSKNLDLESCFQLRMSTKFGIIFDIIEYTICHHIIVPMTLILWIFEYGPGWQIGINFLIGRFPVYYIFFYKKSEVYIYTNCWTKSLCLENWIHTLPKNWIFLLWRIII